jgi:hypothetical protein
MAKPKSKFALGHRVPAVVHLPRLRGAAGDRLEHAVEVEMGGLGKAHGFGQARDGGRQAHLVDHLGGLPGAGLPTWTIRLA